MSDRLIWPLSSFLFFFFRSFLIERLQARKSPASSGSKAKPGAVTLSAGEDLAAGMLAGVASRFFTTPLSNVTVRHQTSSTAKEKQADAKGKEKEGAESDSDDEGEYSDEPGIIETLGQIVKEKGVAGAWPWAQILVTGHILRYNTTLSPFLFLLLQDSGLGTKQPFYSQYHLL